MIDDDVDKVSQGDTRGKGAAKGGNLARKSTALDATSHRLALRTSERLLAVGWCAVPTYFLANYHRLPPTTPGGRKLTSTEAMLVIHLWDHKWDHLPPFPSLATLATRMGITTRAVRKALVHLEEAGFVKRIPDRRRTNKYDMSGIVQALERLMDLELAPKQTKPSKPKRLGDNELETAAA